MMTSQTALLEDQNFTVSAPIDPQVDLTRIYGSEFLQKTFGTLNPTVEQRTRWMFETWRDCRVWSVTIATDVSIPGVVRKQLTELGMQEFTDYLIKGYELRFRSPEHKAIAVLSVPQLKDNTDV